MSSTHRGRRAKQIERWIETWLWRVRLIAIVPVVMSLVSTAVAFICGTSEIFKAVSTIFTAVEEQEIAKVLGKIVGGIDLYLIGIAILIFGYGVYELLISQIDPAQDQDSGRKSSLLDIRSLEELKQKLVKVIVVALIVAGFKEMLQFPINSGQNLLIFSVSVLLLALSANLLAAKSGSD